jgi:predicted nucleotidyltransferase
MNQDFRDMLRLLEEHGVDYLVVGGYAVIRYTQPRYTKDLDIWVRPSKENAAKMAKALRAFGVPLIEVTEEDFAEGGLQFMIGIYPNAIDFLTSIKGLDFDQTWESRKVFETSTGNVKYLSPTDLIIAKRAVGRTQDMADIEEILRIHPEAEPPAEA